MIRIPLLFIVSFICISVFSQDFVYKPISPAFGGETFNYQWL
ncbi:MAG: curli assembly protein CsgF, partial [bacterium]